MGESCLKDTSDDDNTPNTTTGQTTMNLKNTMLHAYMDMIETRFDNDFEG